MNTDLPGIELRPSLRAQCWGFIIGSGFFAAGSTPHLAAAIGATAANTLFFIGSWCFTAAALLQLALSGPATSGRAGPITVRADWLAAAVQLLGTILFNISTGAALRVSSVTGTRRLVWGPNADGSTAFLISAVLTVIALAHTGQAWPPNSRRWWSTGLNLAGAIAFGISVIASIISPDGQERDTTLATTTTFAGALCFATAALLLLPGQQASETVNDDTPPGMNAPPIATRP